MGISNRQRKSHVNKVIHLFHDYTDNQQGINPRHAVFPGKSIWKAKQRYWLVTFFLEVFLLSWQLFMLVFKLLLLRMAGTFNSVPISINIVRRTHQNQYNLSNGLFLPKLLSDMLACTSKSIWTFKLRASFRKYCHACTRGRQNQ